MTTTEAIREIEDAYGKELKPRQREIYNRHLAKFTPEELERITAKTIDDSRYFPKIADFHSAAIDLLIRKRQTKMKADPKCKVCRGSGWEYVKVTCADSGDVVDAGQRCKCRVEREMEPEEEMVPF